jgi:hypothetical protein
VPTGYTAAIKDGISFKKFAMDCARAFGACVILRDEPPGGEAIPEEFTPSDYHEKAARRAREELSATLAMSPQERQQAADKQWETLEAIRATRLEENRRLRAAYESMLGSVDAWTPPTPDHTGLKAFMQTQIKESIDWDCSDEYHQKPIPRLTGEMWAVEKVGLLGRDIEYHDKHHAEEVERTAGRTAWVKALRDSLAETDAARERKEG